MFNNPEWARSESSRFNLQHAQEQFDQTFEVKL